MSNAFDQIIDRHVGAFKDAILNDIRALLSGGTPTKAKKPAKKAAKATKTPKAPKAERKARGPKLDVTAKVEEIVTFVTAHPDGVTGEKIRQAVGADKPTWIKAIRTVLAEKRLTTKGSKRAMTYHVKAAKAAKANGAAVDTKAAKAVAPAVAEA